MPWSPDPAALRGRVAVVAGATRGAQRGIAAALGEAGTTVVCTGRTSVTGRGGSDYDRTETIEETAELVRALGGTRIAVQVDHLDPEQVGGLAELIRRDHGHIDVLVRDIWGGETLKGAPATWGTPGRRPPASSAAPSRHLPPPRSGPAGTSGRSPRRIWPRSTGSPISTALSRTRGA